MSATTNQEAPMSTVSELLTSKRSARGLFIASSHGPEKVVRIDQRHDGPWVVCGAEPFTHSYCVSGGCKLYTDRGAAQVEVDADRA